MNEFWTTHVSRNPMRAESRRLFRKFFSLGMKGTSASRGFLVLVFLYILAFILFDLSSVASVGSEPFLYLITLVMIAAPIFGFYRSIAGERENRSWDLLRVAPLTQSQIVVGKFVSGATVLSAVWLVSLPFPLVAYYSATTGYYSRQVPFEDFILACLIPLATSLLVLTITIFFSARCKTSVAALSITLVMIFVWILILPAVTSIGSMGNDIIGIFSFNPFGAQTALLNGWRQEEITRETGAYTLIVMSLILVPLILFWTEKTLVFAEKRVQFLPKKNNA